MNRILTAGVLGAIVYFIWGMLTWMVVPLHGPTIRPLPAEREIVDAMVAQNLETGVYVVPFPDPDQMSDPDAEFMKNHVAGPIFSIYFQKSGSVPMNGGLLARGFVIELLAAILAAWLLSTIGVCGRNYWCRVGFVASLGIFTALIGHMSYWNWMHFPLGYTLAFVIDVIVGWTLAGLAIAYFVRPKLSESGEDSTAVASKPAASQAAPAAAAKPKPAEPIRNDAISLLATLQREARFLDIVKEPLGDYSDAQVGAAARDVLRDCGAVLDRMFKIAPVVDEEEGATVEIPTDADASHYRIAGSAAGDARSGSLVHHGWQAKQCELPKWTGAKEAALIVSPAELEVK